MNQLNILLFSFLIAWMLFLAWTFIYDVFCSNLYDDEDR